MNCSLCESELATDGDLCDKCISLIADIEGRLNELQIVVNRLNEARKVFDVPKQYKGE
jgi:hypothetical protein